MAQRSLEELHRWLRRLRAKLDQQRKHAEYYDEYYSGRSRLEIVDRDFRGVFGGLFDSIRTNIAAVCVDAVAERSVVAGFRVGDDDDQAGAKQARRIWDANDLDEMSAIAHAEIGVKGLVLGLVWPRTDDNGEVRPGDPAVISIEDPTQMVVEREPSPPYDVIAALKVFPDEWTGKEIAELYLTEGVYTFSNTEGLASELILPGNVTSTRSPTQFVDNPYKDGRVPVVELANRARLLPPKVKPGDPVKPPRPAGPPSRLVDIAPLADANDKLLADMIIAASFGAVPVRYATGLKLKAGPDGRPVDEKGNAVEPYDVRADRVWVSPDPNSRFGTLEGSTLEGFVKAREAVLRDVRTLSRVPYHYFDMGGTSGVAGETLKALEGPLVRLVDGVNLRVGNGWAKIEANALHFTELDGRPVATRWADTETRAEATATDAAAKQKDMGVPLEIILERLGYPDEQIKRAIKLRDEQLLADEARLRAFQQDAGV